MADAFTSDTYNALCREAEDYLGRGLTEQARELLLKAVSLIGTRSRARSLLADACMALGLWSEAREQLEQLITLELGSVQHHYRLGQVLEELKENENALDNYRVVLDLERDHRGAAVAVTRITGHADPSLQAQPGARTAQATARPSQSGSFQVFPDQAGAEDEFATSGDVENLLRDIGVVQSTDPLSGVSELLSSVGISLDPPAPEEKPKVEVKDAGSFMTGPAKDSGSEAFSLESVFGATPEPTAGAAAPAAEAPLQSAPAPEPFDFTSIFRTAEVPASSRPVQGAVETPADPLLQSIFGAGPPAVEEPAAAPEAEAVPEPEAMPEPAGIPEPEAVPAPQADAEHPSAAEPASVPEPEAPAAPAETPSVPAAPAVTPADESLPVLESIFSFAAGDSGPGAAVEEAPAEVPPPSALPEPPAAEPALVEAPPAAAEPVAAAGPPAPEPASVPVQAGDVSLEVIFGEAPAAGGEPSQEPAPEDRPEAGARAEARVEAAVGVPVEAAAGASLESLMEAPVESPAEVSAEAPMEAAIEAPVEAPVETPAEAPVEAPGEVSAAAVQGPALFEIHAAGPDELTRVDLLEGRLEVKLAYVTSMDASITISSEERRRIISGTGTIVLGQASRTPVILDMAPGDLVRSDRLVLHDAGMVFSDAPPGILPSMTRIGGEGGWALAFTGGGSAVLEPGAAGISVRAACIVLMQQGITAEADPCNQGFVRLSGDGTIIVST